MKRIEKTLERGAGYTVLILTLFYLFATIANLEHRNISFDKFLLILAFGMMISVADLIGSFLNCRKIFKTLFHYTILLASFLIIFLFGDFFTQKGLPALFVAIIIFTFLYFAVFGIVHLIYSTVKTADKAFEKRNVQGSMKKKKSVDYTPRFKQ